MGSAIFFLYKVYGESMCKTIHGLGFQAKIINGQYIILLVVVLSASDNLTYYFTYKHN